MNTFGREKAAFGLHDFLIQEILQRSQPTNALDLGCGEAAWLRRLHKAGFGELVGIDLSPPPVAPENMTILSANLESEDLGLKEKTFGLITMIEVIEHMGNPGKLLGHVKRYLRNDGLALITTPNIHSLIQRLKFLVTGRFTHFDYGSDPTHYQPVLLDAWKRLLPSYGLAIADCWTYPRANRLDGVNPLWRHGAAVLQPFFPNRLPGEILCIVLRKA
jgi:SAM-dependent methyltransferase